MAKPLNALTRRKLPTDLPPPSQKEHEAFETLKGLLLLIPILGIPKAESNYIVEVDARYEQLGCCVMQPQPDGEYHPIGYFSRAITRAEKNYFVSELDALAVVWAVTHLQAYLEGTKTLLRCDHWALMSVVMTNIPNQRTNIRRLRRQEFSYQIRHKPGSGHEVADAVSRLPTTGLDTSTIDEYLPVLESATRSDTALMGRAPKGVPEGPIPMAELLAERAKDAFCKPRRK